MKVLIDQDSSENHWLENLAKGIQALIKQGKQVSKPSTRSMPVVQ